MSSSSGKDLAAQLEDARKEINYYKRLATEAAKIRLRETEELSSLVRQLREAKQEREKEKLRFQTLVDQAPHGLVLISPEGHFLYANPNFVEMFGYSLNEIPMGRDWFRKAYPDWDYRHQVIASWVEDSAASPPAKNRPRIFNVTCTGGEEKTVQFNAVQLPSGEDLMTCEDITRRINAEREASEQYSMISGILENASEGICVCHNVDEYPFVRFTHWNRRMSEITGYTIDEINALGWYQTMYPDPKRRDRAIERMSRMRVGDHLRDEEWTITTKAGEERVFAISTSVLGGGKGQTHVLGVMRDATEQKKAEQELRESESNFRSFFEAMEDMLVIGTPDGRIMYSNPAASRKLGFTQDEFQTMSVLDLHPSDVRKEAETILESMSRGECDSSPLPLRTKSGTTVPVETRLSFGKWSGLDCIFGIGKDLSKEQEALQKFNRFFQNNPCPMAVSAMPGREFVDVNDAFLSTLGFSREEAIGKTSSALGLFVDPEANDQVARKLEQDGRVRAMQLRVRRKDQTIVEGLFFGEVIKSQGSEYFLTMMLDISEHKRAHEALKQSEQFLEQILENIPDMVFVKEAENLGFVRFNKAGEELLGFARQELLGKNDYDFFPVEQADFFIEKDREVLRGGRLVDIPHEEIDTRLKGRRILHTKKIPLLGDNGTARFLLGISEDITERKQAEREREDLMAQLLQSQKMEAIGTLAAGIAHDFNNMLQGILGYSEMLLSEKNTGEPGYEELTKIVKTSLEARDLVQKIRIFSRKADIQPISVDLNHQLTELTKLLSHTLAKTIDIDIHLGENLGMIKADPALMDQMVMNLAINASEAMPDKGNLTITTKNTLLDEDFCRLHPGAKPGPHVLLTISDTGRGMSKDLLDRIFEPFFSTKQRDYHRGTGLGLSIVKGIVDEHNGHITCESVVGVGTTFRMYFPILITPETSTTVAPMDLDTTKNETILLVEDEELVKELGIRLLERFGYTVIAARDGQEAVELYAKEQENIALVILDLVMPRMNGKECLQELLNMNPAVKVLISSGVAQEDRVKEVVDMGARGSLLKPYGMKILHEKVRKILDTAD